MNYVSGSVPRGSSGPQLNQIWLLLTAAAAATILKHSFWSNKATASE